MSEPEVTLWPLSTLPRVVASEPVPALAPDLEDAVEAAWDGARARRPGLFNGRLFSIALHVPDPPAGEVAGALVEYKRLVARMEEPALGPRLNLRPLGATGLLLCEGAILLGRRSADSTQDPGAWEVVPAGGMDDVDPARQVLRELEEETGLDADAVAGMAPVCWMLDREPDVRDIVFRIDLAMGRDQLAAHLKAFSTGEHTDFELWPLAAELPADLRGSPVRATCRALVDYARGLVG